MPPYHNFVFCAYLANVNDLDVYVSTKRVRLMKSRSVLAPSTSFSYEPPSDDTNRTLELTHDVQCSDFNHTTTLPLSYC